MDKPNKINWDEYLFHCSSLGELLTASGKITQTCASKLQSIWRRDTWNFNEFLTTKEIQKGNECERFGIDLLEFKMGQSLFKNNTIYTNKYLTGIPDVLIPNIKRVDDIKCPWNLRTFMASVLTPGYEKQLKGYSWLLGWDKCQLDYTLISTPEDTIQKEVERRAWQLGAMDYLDTPEFKKVEEQIRLNMNFDRIPPEQRIKSFAFDLDEKFIEQVEAQAPAWRVYLKNIKL